MSNNYEVTYIRKTRVSIEADNEQAALAAALQGQGTILSSQITRAGTKPPTSSAAKALVAPAAKAPAPAASAPAPATPPAQAAS